MLATKSFATCFPEGWPALAAKTTLPHAGDFRRSLHTAPFTCPSLIDAVMVRGVAFVPIVLFWAGVAFILHVGFWVGITSGLSATPSSLYFKTRLAKHCSPSLSCLSTLAEIATVRINSHRNVHEQNYIKLACDTVPARRTTTTRSNDRRDVTNDRARVTDTQPCFESREVEKQYSKNANMLR